MYNYLQIAKEIVLKRVPLEDYAIFLFGSRVEGNHHQMSDIDIGIWGEKPLSLKIKLELEEELESPIVPYKVDLIDFFQVSVEFKKHALAKIEVWNWSKNSKLN